MKFKFNPIRRQDAVYLFVVTPTSAFENPIREVASCQEPILQTQLLAEPGGSPSAGYLGRHKRHGQGRTITDNCILPGSTAATFNAYDTKARSTGHDPEQSVHPPF